MSYVHKNLEIKYEAEADTVPYARVYQNLKIYCNQTALVTGQSKYLYYL